MEVKQTAWADVNGDGQTDCLLWLEQEREKWVDVYIAVLSLEDRQVYAYFSELHLSEGLEPVAVKPDGSVYFQTLDDYWEQVSFYKNQCYTFPAPEPVHGDGPAWDAFP